MESDSADAEVLPNMAASESELNRTVKVTYVIILVAWILKLNLKLLGLSCLSISLLNDRIPQNTMTLCTIFILILQENTDVNAFSISEFPDSSSPQHTVSDADNPDVTPIIHTFKTDLNTFVVSEVN